MFKPQLIKQGGQTKIVYRPVVLTLPLTPEQKKVAARFTGCIIEQIDLTQEDLQNFSLNFCKVPKDYVEYNDKGSSGEPSIVNYDAGKAKA